MKKKKRKRDLLTYLNAGETPPSPTEGTETTGSLQILTNQQSPLEPMLSLNIAFQKNFVFCRKRLEDSPKT